MLIAIRRAACARCAQFSTSATSLARKKGKAVADPGAMPDERLRALISLYHQSASWVTPENLDRYIDNLFVPRKKDSPGYYRQNDMTSLRNLDDMLSQRHRASKYGGHGPGSAMNPSGYSLNEAWSSAVRLKHAEISQALFGQDKSFKPGLEIVRDAIELDDKQQGLPSTGRAPRKRTAVKGKKTL